MIESVGGDAILGDEGDDDFESHGIVRGGVVLGAGDDRLLIAATSTISGIAEGGEGTDTFVLGGAADAAFDLFQIDSKYLGLDLFRKEGLSRWTLTGTADGPWTVATGTLVVNGTLLGDVLVEAPAGLGGTGSVTIAGMSVFTTMLKAVNERVREIGTLRSLGYRRRHVLALFTLEAALLALVACVVGLVATVALATGVNAAHIGYRLHPRPEEVHRAGRQPPRHAPRTGDE